MLHHLLRRGSGDLLYDIERDPGLGAHRDEVRPQAVECLVRTFLVSFLDLDARLDASDSTSLQFLLRIFLSV